MDATWCMVAVAEIAIVIAAVGYAVWSQRRYRQKRRNYSSSGR